MEELFQNVLTASFHGSIVIGAVLVLRLALKKTPKKFLCLLWLLAGIRLLMPFEIRSDLSLQPAVEEIPYVAEIRQEAQSPVIDAPPAAQPVLTVEPDTRPVELPAYFYEAAPVAPEEPEAEPEEAPLDWLSLIPWVWLAVACCFGVYTLFSYITLKIRVRDAIKISGGWESDRIDTAFILGFIRPRIYIPMGLPLSVRRHILAHERTHLEKGDHWFKMIGFLALAVHWFNPLVWVAYILLCKDIEMACDERVVQFMDLEERKSYSAALLCCSTNRAHFAACPVAFGEVSVKERIMTVLHYKKPGFWISLLGVIAVIFVAVCLLTSPAKEPVAPPPEEITAPTEAASEMVTVKTVDELLAAIASDVEIVLEPGTYVLSDAKDYGKAGTDFYGWKEVYEGWALILTGVENLTIRGGGLHVTTIETQPRHANVITLENCKNVTMEDFTAGHTRYQGECGGGVVRMQNSADITMNRLGLFGCGVVGLDVELCSNVYANDCNIFECSASAAWINSSRYVTLSGCRIYSIGNEPYGGYTFLQVNDSADVLVEKSRLSDSTLNCLTATFNSSLTLRNNLFENNRPQSSAFDGTRGSLILDGNKFEGNTIRSWYSYEDVAQDASGKILTAEDLDRIINGEPEEKEKLPQLQTHVSTVDEFIAAIGPNTEIILDAELYDFSTATGYGTSNGEYYFWEDIYDGPGLIIRNVENMTIRSATGDKDKHTLAAIPRYADVLNFRACSDITLIGFTAGHTKEQGSCAGGVLEFADCDGMTVEDCGLFGCGILGVQADNCSEITVKNTEIYECSQGGIQLWNVNGATIEGTSFRDIGGTNYLNFNGCRNITVEGDRLIGSEQGSLSISTPEQDASNGIRNAIGYFTNYFFFNDSQNMARYVTDDYAGDVWTAEEDGNASFYWLDISNEQVYELWNKGSLTVRAPFRWIVGSFTGEEEEQFLQITVVEVDGEYKVSKCVIE